MWSLIIKVWLPVFAHLVLYRLRIDILDTCIKMLGIDRFSIYWYHPSLSSSRTCRHKFGSAALPLLMNNLIECRHSLLCVVKKFHCHCTLTQHSKQHFTTACKEGIILFTNCGKIFLTKKLWMPKEILEVEDPSCKLK